VSDRPKTVEYQLRWPIQLGNQQVTSLTLRRPKAKDLRMMPGDGASMADTLDLIGRLAGQPRPIIDEMDGEDVQEVSKIVLGFSGSGHPTGEEPAP
jgi:hypothetical protein